MKDVNVVGDKMTRNGCKMTQLKKWYPFQVNSLYYDKNSKHESKYEAVSALNTFFSLCARVGRWFMTFFMSTAKSQNFMKTMLKAVLSMFYIFCKS